MLADSGPSEDALFGSQMVCPQMDGRRATVLSGASFIKDTNPIRDGFTFMTLSSPKGPKFKQMPSY